MIKLKTLFQNIGANTFTMVIIMLFQLLSVSLFIAYWGLELYGEWLVLNVFTAYFQMTDVGFNTATANKVSFLYVKKKFKECDVLINNNLVFIIIAFIMVFFVLVTLIKLNIVESIFQFKIITSNIIISGLILLLAQVFVGTLNNFLNTIYRATDLFARGVMIDNIIRISEYIALLLGVVLGLSIPIILFLGLVIKVVGLAIKFIDSRKFYRFNFGLKFVNLYELRVMALPAISFFSIPIANSFLFQGFTLLINIVLGSIPVVLWTTTRRMVNFIKALIDILQKSIWPELSLAYGRSDILSLKKLHRYALAGSLFIVILFSGFLLVFGEGLYKMWTNYKLEYDSTLFFLLLITLILNAIWSSSSIILQATNNHKMFSLLYLITSLLVITISYEILVLFNTLSYLPLTLIVMDFIMILYVIPKSLSITNDTTKTFCRGIRRDYNSIKATMLGK